MTLLSFEKEAVFYLPGWSFRSVKNGGFLSKCFPCVTQATKNQKSTYGVNRKCLIYGADMRSRTADLLITNQLLYQLSYIGLMRCTLGKVVPVNINFMVVCQDRIDARPLDN